MVSLIGEIWVGFFLGVVLGVGRVFGGVCKGGNRVLLSGF